METAIKKPTIPTIVDSKNTTKVRLAADILTAARRDYGLNRVESIP